MFAIGWSINWEVLHSKVKGIQLNGTALEAIYKSKRSGVCMNVLVYTITIPSCMYMYTIQFDKLQSKYSPSYRLPNNKVARVSELSVIDALNVYISL